MVRGVARLWVTSPKLSINRVGGEERRERLELVPLPLIPFGYTKTTKGETKCEET